MHMFKCLSNLFRYAPIAMMGLGFGLIVGFRLEGIAFFLVGFLWSRK